MSRFMSFFILTAGIIMALIAGVLTYERLKETHRRKEEVIPATKVAVAAKDLSRGTKLTGEMIKTVSWPKDTLPSGCFTAPEDLTDRVLLFAVRENQPILENLLAPKDVTVGGLCAILNPHKRAMAVRVDDVIGVGGLINPQSRVDVFVTMHEGASGVSKPLSKVVLQNILVLAVGNQIEQKDQEAKAGSVKVVTLEVTPEEGEKLALAVNSGRIQLALRNPLNTETIETKGATIPALLACPRSSPPKARLDYFTVKIMKGGTLTEERF